MAWAVCKESTIFFKTIRYVGVFQPSFHVLHFLPIRFTQQNLCYISKSRMKHQQISDGKLDLPWFDYGYWKCMFLDSLTEYIGLSSQLCSIECGVVLRTWSRNPIAYKHVSLQWLFFNPRLPTQINYRCPIKNSNRNTCIPYSYEL